MKKESIGPGLHLRPVRADHARPLLQWALNSLWERQWKEKTPSRQGNLEDRIQVTHHLRENTLCFLHNHPCLWTVSIRM